MWWNLPRPRPRPLSLPDIYGGMSIGSGIGNGTLLKAQWLPRPVRVCRPLEVPIAKSGLGFVVAGQAAEDQREVVVRMRMGWVTTLYVSGFIRSWSLVMAYRMMASGNHRPLRGLGEVGERERSRRSDRCPLLCWFLLV